MLVENRQPESLLLSIMMLIKKIVYFLRPEPDVLFTFATLTFEFCLKHFFLFFDFVLLHDGLIFNFQPTNITCMEECMTVFHS